MNRPTDINIIEHRSQNVLGTTPDVQELFSPQSLVLRYTRDVGRLMAYIDFLERQVDHLEAEAKRAAK